MRIIRLSIRTLMAIVAVVAIELAVGRAVLEYEPDLFVEIVLNALTVQLAVFLLIRSRNCKRAFWIAFAASSVVAAISCCYALSVGSDSLVGLVWFEYLGRAQECTGVEVFVSGFKIPLRPPTAYEVFVHAAQMALIFYLPQLAIALFAGLVTLFLAWLAQLFRRRPPFEVVLA
jgi:hypothetical protein